MSDDEVTCGITTETGRCGGPYSGHGVTLTINDPDLRLAEGVDPRIPLCDEHYEAISGGDLTGFSPPVPD